jgi:hypothetical protein
MIKKNGLRSFGYFVTAAFLATGLAACGDDGGDGNIVDPPGCEPGSHGACGETFSLNEGGEFRIELFQFGVDDATTTDDWDVAAQAFFFTTDDGPRSLDGIFNDMTQCGDYRSGDNFDNGATPQAQAIVDRRTYFDVGPEVVVTPMGGGNPITFPRRMDAVDLSAGLTHPILYSALKEENDGLIDEIQRNAYYTLSGVGSDDGFAGLDLGSGVSAQGEEAELAAAYIPPNFTMTTPPEADVYGDGVAPAQIVTRGEDFRFEWTNDTPVDEGSVTNLGFIGVFNNAGGVDFYCYEPDGSTGGGVTLDATVSAELGEDAESEIDGYFLVGKFTHVGWEDANNNRFDFLGVNCKFVSFDAVDP